jgi:hypothetical protein
MLDIRLSKLPMDVLNATPLGVITAQRDKKEPQLKPVAVQVRTQKIPDKYFSTSTLFYRFSI